MLARCARVGTHFRVAQSALRAFHSSGVRLADADSASALKLTFTLPSKTLYLSAPVEMVILPGSDGEFGVMPSHVPTITMLKPGVVSIQEEAGGSLKKYFISGGFATSNHSPHLQCPVLAPLNTISTPYLSKASRKSFSHPQIHLEPPPDIQNYSISIQT